jgi:peptide/nickel transport system permease protein
MERTVGDVWIRFARHKTGLVSLLFILALVLLAFGYPVLTPYDPGAISNDVMLPPSAAHWFGTDDLGRDVFAGMCQGIQVSLTVGFAAALASSVIGVLLGSAAGFLGGKFDLGLMRFSEVFQVMPSFILAAVIVALAGPGLTRVVVVIAILAWPQIARVMRGEVLRVRQLEFIDAVRCLGFREGSILFRQIIPNAIAPVLPIGTLIVGQAILLEASLSFLGLSAADLISWGRMLNSGQRFLFNAWWLSFFPGAAIFLTVLAFNLIGDAVGAALNPKTKHK